MQYKTVIEVVTEAENKGEAIEIVGEYLSGHLVSGIDMKYHTTMVSPGKQRMVAVMAIIILFAAGLLTAMVARPSQRFMAGVSGVDAIQVPLKTSVSDYDASRFKKEWNNQHTSEALNHIKKAE